MIRILLVEDHATVREGIRLLVDAEPDMTVVGQAEDGETAIERTAALTPAGGGGLSPLQPLAHALAFLTLSVAVGAGLLCGAVTLGGKHRADDLDRPAGRPRHRCRNACA